MLPAMLVMLLLVWVPYFNDLLLALALTFSFKKHMAFMMLIRFVFDHNESASQGELCALCDSVQGLVECEL